MIQIKNLFFSYTGSAPFVLEDISLEIKDGEYISVLGENGCGKSTLIRLILKLLKPTSGMILCTAKKIGYVPQKSDSALSQFPITVLEMLNCYRRILKIRDKTVSSRCLELVKMSGYKNALVGTLSGGQFQKIMLARAMMGNPDLLILDEPSTGVDRKSQREVYALIKALNREQGITVISVEHNLEAAIANSTQIYHLAGGNGHLCSPEKYAEEYLGNGGNQNAE